MTNFSPSFSQQAQIPKNYVFNYYDSYFTDYEYPNEEGPDANGVTPPPIPTVPPYYTDSTDDPLIDEFAIKDGSPIPLLEMTYINKTKPMPCDKEVI